jgi:Flp pilus assembly protein TadD
MVLNSRSALDDPPSIVGAAIVLAAVGDSEAAEAALTLLGGRWFPHLFAQLAVERNELETALSRLAGLTDSASGGLRGWIELQRHHYREAVQAFRAVIAAGSSSPDVYVNLGYAYGALGSLPKAIRATRTAFGMAPASRTAGFNLASFYSAAGDMESALTVLDRLRHHHPDELAPLIASASIRARFGDLERAERELHLAERERAVWAADAIGRGTLKANLVAIRQARSRISTKEAFLKVRAIVEQLEYKDLGIARLLPFWMLSTRQAPDAQEILHELSLRHPSNQLGAFRTHASFLRLDFEAAISEARRWTADEPFDPSAVIMLTYLLIETQDAPDEAARIGKAALQRMPSDKVIRNNLAYALVLLNQLEEATRVLGPLKNGNEPLCLATAGLIQIRLGRIDDGLAMYERAAVIAERANAADLADLIRQRGAIEAGLAGRVIAFDIHSIAAKHDTDPRFLLNGLRMGRK